MPRTTAVPAMGKAAVRAYTSPTLVLLAVDWDAGKDFDDFLGFAILRAPGFHPGEKDGYLLNKISFQKPGPNSQSLPSNVAPFQKFLWWDSAITDADRGRQFQYTITPVRGTGANDLRLQHEAETTVTVSVPPIERNGISTWFNRAVVSSQSFQREFPDPEKDLDAVMKWLANGMQDAFSGILDGATEIDGAIYHLTDKEWVVPALQGFKGSLSLVYEDRTNDTADRPAVTLLKSARFTGHARSKTNIMHDKFLVDKQQGRVLMGSANFTPEGLTSQANLLHIINSPELAQLYSERQRLLRDDPTIGDTAKGAAWSDSAAVGKAKIRVFFSPEPKNERTSIDTVIKSIQNAKQSVVFCMFDPTDPQLLQALLATGDKKKVLYGLLNSISDPTKTKQTEQTLAGEKPNSPASGTTISVTLFNRSRKDKKVLAYSYFHKGAAPAGFLPELSAIDMSSRSTLPPPQPGKKGGPPAVHIHHKFIVIDAETDHPVIYTGSANLSNNSTHNNDENLLEITGDPELAQTYFAEFMRLYEHYRARAIWNMVFPAVTAGKKPQPTKHADALTLKTNRDAWVKGAYKTGTQEFLARTRLSGNVT